MFRHFKGIIIFLTFILCSVILGTGLRISQIYVSEKNSGDIIKATIKIKFNKDDVVKLRDGSYLTRSNIQYIKVYLKKRGWNYEEQLGSGYSFINPKGGRLLLVSRYVYGTDYLIFENSNNIKIE